MKQFITLFALTFLSSNVFAHPGYNQLVCKSAKDSGSKQRLEVFLKRSNATGWAVPEISVTVDGKKTNFPLDSEDNSYGTTIHNSPLKVIVVTADVDGNFFSVMAMPESVKAGKWTLEAEKEDCYDSYGKVSFKGVIRGQFEVEDGTNVKVDAQILDCEFSYNPGMGC